MRYDEYLANGWPIASGPVEGACKNPQDTASEMPGGLDSSTSRVMAGMNWICNRLSLCPTSFLIKQWRD